MRIAITGEKGFIAQNLKRIIINRGHEFVSLIDEKELAWKCKGTDEPCIYENGEKVWSSSLSNNSVDILIHNAAVVGTDVVALNTAHSTMSNVAGTHTIARAATAANIPVCYIGTTVIYDTQNYQDSVITETSSLNPRTFYGIQKLSAERIIKHNCNDWMIIRPLFAYGGLGDMNSLIAKSIYACKNNHKSIDMFLDPEKIKDYMHVDDFCNAVLTGCLSGRWGEDYNVAAETPYNTREIVEIISKTTGFDVASAIKWYPKTDYLGNHVLSSRKFRSHTGWSPDISLDLGIQMSAQTIMSDTGKYNPLKYLNEAKEKGIDLTVYY
ncbi:NAD(P)-dependent oxidoreductase [bacterium]|nr:NAD(P)-dependent oxidoreductase [bacterium]